MALICRNLSFSYDPSAQKPDGFLLHDVDFFAEVGTISALTGKSGAGKSTLLSCLVGELTPKTGSLSCDGLLPTDPGYAALFGRVRQQPEIQLFAKTAYDDVAFGPQRRGISGSDLRTRVEEALSAMELSSTQARQRSPFEYSGGEKRRLAIAGILALQPRYLLLDEPTSGLDPRATQMLMRLIEGLAQQQCAIVIVSHDLEMLYRYAHKIYVLDKGTVTVGEEARAAVLHPAFRDAGLLCPSLPALLDSLSRKGMVLDDAAWQNEEAASIAIANAIRNAHGSRPMPTAIACDSQASSDIAASGEDL